MCSFCFSVNYFWAKNTDLKVSYKPNYCKSSQVLLMEQEAIFRLSMSMRFFYENR